MAIKPDALALTPEELESAKSFEEKLDGELHRSYVEGARVFTVRPNMMRYPSERVASEIRRRYIAAGWKEVTHNLGWWTFKKE